MVSTFSRTNQASHPGSLMLRATLLVASLLSLSAGSSAAQTNDYLFNDTHFHLTNYIQEGTDIHDFLKIMGDKVGRVAIFGIPLQQQWSYRVDGNRAPTYYLNSDAPLYYYSFTDAWIATAYRTPRKPGSLLSRVLLLQPGDMFAAVHIRRITRTVPASFTGIGEFSIKNLCGEIRAAESPAYCLRSTGSILPARLAW